MDYPLQKTSCVFAVELTHIVHCVYDGVKHFCPQYILHRHIFSVFHPVFGLLSRTLIVSMCTFKLIALPAVGALIYDLGQM